MKQKRLIYSTLALVGVPAALAAAPASFAAEPANQVTTASASALGAPSIGALAGATDNRALIAEERQQTEALLQRLAEYEQRVATERATSAPMYVAASNNEALSARLSEALEAKRQLQSQQERFISEILRLKGKLRELEGATPEAQHESFEKREAALLEELSKERKYAEKLKRQVEDQKAAFQEQLRDLHRSKGAAAELETERQRGHKLHEQIRTLEAELEKAGASAVKEKELRSALVKTRQAAERLELELQYKKQIEQDNEHLRAELQKVKQELASVSSRMHQKDSQEKTLQANAVEQKGRIATLEKDRQALELELAGQQTKLAAVRGELDTSIKKNEASAARIATLENELAEKKKVIAATTGFGTETRKLHEQIERLERELAAEHERRQTVLAQKQTSEEALEKHRIALRHLKDKLDAQDKTLSEKDEELVALKRQLSKTIEEARVLQLSFDEKQAAIAGIPEIEQQLSGVREELAKATAETQACQTDLEASQASVGKLQQVERELLAAKNELLMKETELKLLSNVSKVGRAERAKLVADLRKNLPAQGGAMESSGPSLHARLAGPAAAVGAIAAVPVANAAPLADVVILEVTGSKVNLRSGPGEEHSPIMQVQEGTRLTVEDREGDWYRVFTPTGARAFVREDVVKVIDNGTAVQTVNSGPRLAPALAAAVQQSAPGVADEARAPQQPAARAAKADRDLVPFGRVKLAGNKEHDIETAAIERLKASFQERLKSDPRQAE
ncbi:MAG: SH3 domain-containing protein [Bdellovibrionales bacterium]|nr:SH3 domain-containing protein [Bdellovibrionales bacterium]